MAPVFICSSLGEVGGALRYTWDLLRLWRSNGVPCRLLLPQTPNVDWQQRLVRLGLPWSPLTALCDAACLAEISELPGSAILGICSNEFLIHAQAFRKLHCRLIWQNCMTTLWPAETRFYAARESFDAHVFDSNYQRTQLESQLIRFGYTREQGHLLPAAFAVDDWPFAPRALADEEFVIGKLARPDISKWSRNYWKLLSRVRHPQVRGLAMGVNDTVRKWMGPTPDWAQSLPPGALPAAEFYRRLHCLVPVNFGCLENWPRVGLEAMATGVPIVAPREGGWCDQIVPGETGFLAGNAEELVDCVSSLANDEALRLRIARQARQRLEMELCDPAKIWRGWQRLLKTLDAA